MILNSYDLPKPNGASDWQDSPVIAGLTTIFDFKPTSLVTKFGDQGVEYVPFKPIQMNKYVRFDKNRLYYQRDPGAVKNYDFSRDQAILLFAGLEYQGQQHYVDAAGITGKDWLPPSVKGHEARCKGQAATWFQDQWLKTDILFHAKCTPLGEPNQIIAMMMCHPNRKSLFQVWCSANPKWEECIKVYWCGWRAEPELALWIITVIRGYL